MKLISPNKTFLKVAFILATVSFLFMGVFGIFHHISDMKTGEETASGSNCLFNGQTELCTVNFSEHITYWQGLFTTRPVQFGMLSLILLMILFAVVVLWKNLIYEFFEFIASWWRFYIKQLFQIHFFDSLREAFSQGILNTKIYEFIK